MKVENDNNVYIFNNIKKNKKITIEKDASPLTKYQNPTHETTT